MPPLRAAQSRIDYNDSEINEVRLIKSGISLAEQMPAKYLGSSPPARTSAPWVWCNDRVVQISYTEFGQKQK